MKVKCRLTEMQLGVDWNVPNADYDTPNCLNLYADGFPPIRVKDKDKNGNVVEFVTDQRCFFINAQDMLAKRYSVGRLYDVLSPMLPVHVELTLSARNVIQNMVFLNEEV